MEDDVKLASDSRAGKNNPVVSLDQLVVTPPRGRRSERQQPTSFSINFHMNIILSQEMVEFITFYLIILQVISSVYNYVFR